MQFLNELKLRLNNFISTVEVDKHSQSSNRINEFSLFHKLIVELMESQHVFNLIMMHTSNTLNPPVLITVLQICQKLSQSHRGTKLINT